jgi:hypothetical protein
MAEMAFMHKAATLGFGVAKPFGDSARYDCIVDTGRRLWRVQVKSSSAIQHGAYPVNAQRNCNGRAIPYTAKEIDFLMAQVVPENAWFVIPVRAFVPRKSLRVYPAGDGRVSRYEVYREAWELMG